MKHNVFVINDSGASLPEAKRLEDADNRIEVAFHIEYNKNKHYCDDPTMSDKELLKGFLDLPVVSTDDKQKFLQNLKNRGIDVSTAQPNVGEYLTAYKKAAKLGATAILAVPMSRELSGSIKSAEQAIDLFMQERVTKGYYEIPVKIAEYINSVSMVQGMKVLEAEKLAKDGLSIDEIKETVESDDHPIHAIEIVSDLKQLRKGGRIGRAQHMVGGILGIKPILTIRDGVLDPLDKKKIKGWENAIEHSLEYIYQQVGKSAVRASFVQFESKDEHVTYLYNRAHEYFDIQEETKSKQCYVLNAHTGTNILGIAVQEMS
ncbi:MAG: DegV family protein [Candidatus Saccharibacteria bacterium]